MIEPCLRYANHQQKERRALTDVLQYLLYT
jgi:hypothetical protein